MSEKVTHTPTPWTIDDGDRIFWDMSEHDVSVDWPLTIRSEYDPGIVAFVMRHTEDGHDRYQGIGESTAAFIVRACNAHAALVAALDAMTQTDQWSPEYRCWCFKHVPSERCRNTPRCEKVRAALALAKETP